MTTSITDHLYLVILSFLARLRVFLCLLCSPPNPPTKDPMHLVVHGAWDGVGVQQTWSCSRRIQFTISNRKKITKHCNANNNDSEILTSVAGQGGKFHTMLRSYWNLDNFLNSHSGKARQGLPTSFEFVKQRNTATHKFQISQP